MRVTSNTINVGPKALLLASIFLILLNLCEVHEWDTSLWELSPVRLFLAHPAALAHSVERLRRNEKVVSSILTSSSRHEVQTRVTSHSEP